MLCSYEHVPLFSEYLLILKVCRVGSVDESTVSTVTIGLPSLRIIHTGANFYDKQLKVWRKDIKVSETYMYTSLESYVEMEDGEL